MVTSNNSAPIPLALRVSPAKARHIAYSDEQTYHEPLEALIASEKDGVVLVLGSKVTAIGHETTDDT